MSVEIGVQFGLIDGHEEEVADINVMARNLEQVLGIDFHYRESGGYEAYVDEGNATFFLDVEVGSEESVCSHPFYIDIQAWLLMVDNKATQKAHLQREAMSMEYARRVFGLLMDSGRFMGVIFRDGLIVAFSHFSPSVESYALERPVRFYQRGAASGQLT